MTAGQSFSLLFAAGIDKFPNGRRLLFLDGMAYEFTTGEPLLGTSYLILEKGGILRF